MKELEPGEKALVNRLLDNERGRLDRLLDETSAPQTREAYIDTVRAVESVKKKVGK